MSNVDPLVFWGGEDCCKAPNDFVDLDVENTCLKYSRSLSCLDTSVKMGSKDDVVPSILWLNIDDFAPDIDGLSRRGNLEFSLYADEEEPPEILLVWSTASRSGSDAGFKNLLDADLLIASLWFTDDKGLFSTESNAVAASSALSKPFCFKSRGSVMACLFANPQRRIATAKAFLCMSSGSIDCRLLSPASITPRLATNALTGWLNILKAIWDGFSKTLIPEEQSLD